MSGSAFVVPSLIRMKRLCSMKSNVTSKVPLCWLLVVSVGQNWPMRTPNHASCSLPISQRKCTISGIHLLNFTKGDGYCARNSHLHHAVDTLVSSVAPSPLPRLDQARHLLPLAGDADRPCQS